MSGPGRCLVVVVLYRLSAHDSTTVRGIVDAMQNDRHLRENCEVLLWDNTPSHDLPADQPGPIPDLSFSYRQAPVNDGVAGACNAAMRICIHRGCEWMLLLDQDTIVTRPYLEGMLEYRQMVHDMADVAAIVPLLLDKDFQLSPKRVLRFRDQPILPTAPGILDGEVFAANSGVMLRVSALRDIGGYSRDFWLDHSDMYVFHQFYLRHRRIFFASDLSLQHSMTMLDYDGSMSPARYGNFLVTEQAFFDLYKGSTENAVQVLRLLIRVFRQYRRYHNKIYSKMTLRFLLNRLRTTKAGRMRSWKRRADERRNPGLTNVAGRTR